MPQYTIDRERAFGFLKTMGFVRVAGSAEELRAAELIRDQLADAGLTGVIEPFEITDAECCTATLEVLAPYTASYTVTAYKNSGNTPAEGIEGDFLYVEDATDVDLARAKGKIVLVNGYLRLPVYKKLRDAGVAAFITMNGDMLDADVSSDLYTRELRKPLRSLGAPVPGVNLSIMDAFEMVKKGATRVKVSVNTTMKALTSHNVVATIPGTDRAEETLCLAAHYDSVEFSTGVYDNGAGSVILLELARWYAAHPPRRTLQFIWCGAEEVGLEGSKAFVRDHAETVNNCRMLLNVDVGASVLGRDIACLIADDSVVAYTDCFMKINGYPVKTERDIYSSDCMPFSDLDVPSINFYRVAAPGAGYIHCRHDIIDWLSAEGVEKTAVPMLAYTDALVGAEVFPFARKVPADLHEKIDGYFYKKEQAEAAKAQKETE